MVTKKITRSFKWLVALTLVQGTLVLSFSNCSAFQSVGLNGANTLFADQGQNVTTPGLKYQCSDRLARGMTDDGLTRLTTPELSATLATLLGSDFIKDSIVAGQLAQLSSDVIVSTITEYKTDPAVALPNVQLAIAMRASALIADVPAKAEALFGACATQTAITDACMMTMIQSFGLKAFRRPVTTEETQSYMASFTDGGKGALGLKRVFMRFMMNPSMTYHIENGTADVGERTRLTDYEIASRISYRTIGTMPDDALFAAAAKGELQSLNTVQAHVTRLLSTSPLGKARIDDFFRVYLQIDPTQLSNASSEAAAADGVDITGLREEMIQETKDYYNYIVWTKRGKFSDLFKSTAAFPRSARMAKILGTGVSDGVTPVVLPQDHVGILLRPSFLSSSSNRTAAMHRGVNIRRRYLCQPLGDPPAAAVTARTNELGDLSLLGNRDQLTQLTSAPLCMGCHTVINSLGFALEGYDQIGMSRTSENIFVNGAIVKTLPVNTSVTGLALESGAKQAAGSGAELSQILSQTTAASACFAKSVFESTRLRAASEDDYCLLREMENAALDNGSIINVFVNNVATEDIFWKAKGL